MTEYDGSIAETSGWRPRCIREAQELHAAKGLMLAVHELLERDNITVNAGGPLDTMADHPYGMLFVGNHSRQFEFVALMEVMSRLGRTSMKHIAKFYVGNQLRWAFGGDVADAILPVYPRLLATDRRNKFNLELFSRIAYRSSLKDSAESARLNDLALESAAQELSEGGLVNIYPCGSIVNNMRHPWRAGVGRILTSLPEEDRDNILVVPYHADNINRTRLIMAGLARGRGIFGRPQEITVEFGEPCTVAETIGSLPYESQRDPVAITDALRAHYVASLMPSATPSPT
jgi:hypothetical protein